MSTLSKQIVIAPQEVFVGSSTQGTDLGQLATTGDGRFFRYAKAGGVNLVAGTLLQCPAADATNLQPIGGLSVGQANATGTYGPLTLSDSITVTANQLAGGQMVIVAGVATGFSYQIKSNTAVSAATGLSITLGDALQQNLTTSTRVALIPNPYNGVIIAPATKSGSPVGVAVSNLASGTYGWIQTRGVAPVLTETTGVAAGVAVGTNLANTAGAVSPSTGFAVFSQVGYSVAPSASGQYSPTDIHLD